MKLKIEHLAPYLPYNTLCMASDDKIVPFDFLDASIEHQETILILKPLSDLVNNITDYPDIEEEFSVNSWEGFVVAFSYPRSINCFDFIDYTVASLLFKHHFDVFDLIKHNHAVSIHDIK